VGIVFKNNAKTTLASSLSNSATSATVTDGAVFPSLSAGEHFLITFDDGSNNEICKCTARSGNTLTIVRAQESTTARSFSSGDAAEGRVTAGVLETIQENIAAKSANQTVFNATTSGNATTYNIGVNPGVEANAMVFLNGVLQHHDTISFSGVNLTFDTAPPNGMALEVIVDNLINLQSSNLTVDSFTAADVGGSPQTAFTLSDTPAAETNLIVFVDGVFQDQDAYTISSNTLTITTGVIAGRGVTVYIINPVNIGTPSDGTVTSAKLSGNITTPGTLTVGSYDVAFDSPTFFVDHTNSRVGLGTASPSVPVDIVGDVKMSANLTVDTSTLVVDSSNNRVGIGISSPDGTCHIHSGSAGTITAAASGNNLVVENSGAVGMSLLFDDAANNAYGNIYWGNETDGSADGRITYFGSTYVTAGDRQSMVFRTANTERMRINSSGNVGISTTTIPHGSVGYAKFAIDGTNANSAGPHVQYTTSTDDYPVFQQLNWSHDNISLNFDSYYDGQWRSSDAGSNFQIYKNADLFTINYDSGIAAGSVLNWVYGLTMKSDGKVGIGQSNPQTALHVFGTDPVIRVSDDSTSGFATLELRQQNTATEGTELIYDSGTGKTHLNTVFNADLNIATNTGSFGTTSTNTRLTVKNDGVIEVGKSSVSTDRIKFVGNTNIGSPDTSNHDLGTRLSLYDSGATSWYAIGIESNHMWFNADGGAFKFYQQAVQKIHFDGTNSMPVVRVGPSATNAMRLGTATAVFPYSGISLIVAQSGAALTVHSGTNTAGSWQNLASDFPDYLAGTATFSTINTSQQANIIVYLNVATKTYLVRDSGWNAVSTSGWIRISDDNVYSTGTSQVYVKYLQPGTHSLDNDSALYFFEAPIGP
jgi:hypothetical protein